MIGFTHRLEVGDTVLYKRESCVVEGIDANTCSLRITPKNIFDKSIGCRLIKAGLVEVIPASAYGYVIFLKGVEQPIYCNCNKEYVKVLANRGHKIESVFEVTQKQIPRLLIDDGSSNVGDFRFL